VVKVLGFLDPRSSAFIRGKFLVLPRFSPCLRASVVGVPPITRDVGDDMRFRDFATHCRYTLSQTPTPHKRFVENKHQSAIRQDSHKTCRTPLFLRFLGSESRFIKTSLSCPVFAEPQWNHHSLQISQFSSAESIGRGLQPQNAKTQPQAG